MNLILSIGGKNLKRTTDGVFIHELNHKTRGIAPTNSSHKKIHRVHPISLYVPFLGHL